MHEANEGVLRERVEGVSVMERNIPPPFTALHEVKVFVSSRVREAVDERVPEIAPPFPDECVRRENVHPVIVAVVAELDPPSTFTIDALTLAASEVDSDVTVTDVNVSDP